MKYIKTYEKLKRKPKIGDYVITNEYQESDTKYFTDNNIGQIKGILKTHEPYQIFYNNIPDYLKICFSKRENQLENCRRMRESEIAFYSTNYKKCEEYLKYVENPKTRKFNI